MINSFTRMAGLALAFGFFFGCASSKNSSDQSAGAPTGSLSKTEIKQRVSELEKQLGSGSKSTDLYLRKGALLTKWAQKEQEPTKRTPIYFKADKALTMADSLSRTQPAIHNKREEIDQLRKVAWSNEHNQGVQIWQNASERQAFLRAAIHFENATAIMPDSATSYLMASKAFYKGKQPQKAIAELERARSHVKTPSRKLLESLAFLYLETDQPEHAVPVFKEARTRDNLNYNLIHGLANAYIKTGDHQQALALLRTLSAKKPSSIIYKRSLASELYQAAKTEIDRRISTLSPGQAISDSFLAKVGSLLQEAQNIYEDLLDKREDNRDIQAEAARFYQNAAGRYQQLLTYLNGTQKKKFSDTVSQYLSASVPLLENLVEQNPNKQWWQSLYQAYVYLGMEQKANQAKANF